MSYTTISYLYCDGDDCPGDGEPYDSAIVTKGGRGSTITEQRAKAKRADGWTHRNGKDYCADCSEGATGRRGKRGTTTIR